MLKVQNYCCMEKRRKNKLRKLNFYTVTIKKQNELNFKLFDEKLLSMLLQHLRASNDKQKLVKIQNIF